MSNVLILSQLRYPKTYARVRLDVLRVVRNLRDQTGLTLLDLDSDIDLEKMQCRFEFIEEFSRYARHVLKSCVVEIDAHELIV